MPKQPKRLPALTILTLATAKSTNSFSFHFNFNYKIIKSDEKYIWFIKNIPAVQLKNRWLQKLLQDIMRGDMM